MLNFSWDAYCLLQLLKIESKFKKKVFFKKKLYIYIYIYLMIIYKTIKTNLVRNKKWKWIKRASCFATLVELNTNNNRVIHKVLLCFSLCLILTFPPILPFWALRSKVHKSPEQPWKHKLQSSKVTALVAFLTTQQSTFVTTDYGPTIGGW
jgi:hypothetical protein